MQSFLAGIIAALLSWCIAKFIKLKKGNSFFSSGGVVSVHSATAWSVVIIVFLYEGFSSIFLVALFLGILVARDSFGVRKAVGEHAKSLQSLGAKHVVIVKGHSVPEVIKGICIGLVCGVVVYAGINFIIN